LCWYPITAYATIATRVAPDSHSSLSAAQKAFATMPAMMIVNDHPVAVQFVEGLAVQ
jgi:hypothetical protein